jgi:phage terminase large subunit-like protein
MVKADDNGHKKLVKPKRLTNSKRIDLAMALVMAAGVMTLQEAYSDPYSDGRAKLN